MKLPRYRLKDKHRVCDLEDPILRSHVFPVIKPENFDGGHPGKKGRSYKDFVLALVEKARLINSDFQPTPRSKAGRPKKEKK